MQSMHESTNSGSTPSLVKIECQSQSATSASAMCCCQPESEYECDPLMLLLLLHPRSSSVRYTTEVLKKDELNQFMKQLDAIVWPRILQLLNVDNSHDNGGHDAIDGNDDDGHAVGSNPSRIRMVYDVTRRDSIGRTALHLACSGPTLSEGSCVYRVLARLLSLGADANAMTNDGLVPIFLLVLSSGFDPWIPAMEFLLRHGADLNLQAEPNDETFIHRLIYLRRFRILRDMYAELSYYMSAIDYSLTVEGSADEVETIIQYASNRALFGSYRQHDQKLDGIILTLLKTERQKQYMAIRSLLRQHTPLRLNHHTDLTDVVFAYIAAEDYDE